MALFTSPPPLPPSPLPLQFYSLVGARVEWFRLQCHIMESLQVALAAVAESQRAGLWDFHRAQGRQKTSTLAFMSTLVGY